MLGSGGTALPDTRKFPLIAVLGAALVGAAVIIVVGVLMRKQPAAATPRAIEPAAQAPAPAPQAAVEAPLPAAPTPAQPDPQLLATNLERALRKQRLWSTVGIIGGRVEVRSSSCSDPAMAPLLDGAAPGFKAAGLTKLRCVEQSGQVVTARDL